LKKGGEEAIGQESRALLWYDGKPFAGYHHAVDPDQCKLAPNDKLKTVSVVLRSAGEETDPNALVYVRRRYGVDQPLGAGYLRIVQAHTYHLNITFAAGSLIAKMIGEYGWRPMVYVNSKGPGEKRKIDLAYPLKGLLIFGNFNTNWAERVELAPHPLELRLAANARVQDTYDEDRSKMALVPPGGVDPNRSFAVQAQAAKPQVTQSAQQAIPLAESKKTIPFAHGLSPMTSSDTPLDTTNPNP
jgi:hypothetical protein